MKQVNKYAAAALLALSAAAPHAFASDANVKVAPVVCFSDDGTVSEENGIYLQLTSELNKYWFGGLVTFSSIERPQAGNIQSVFDAAAVCQSEHCDYILYGYIKTTDQALSAEIKLYSDPDKKIEQTFYAQDNTDEQDRLVLTLADHIADYICLKTGTQKQPVPAAAYSMSVSVPFTVGYWTLLNDVMRTRILGTGQVLTGLDFEPPIPLDTVRNRKNTLIFRAAAGFKYAYGNPDYYPAQYYSIIASAPVILGVNLNKWNQLQFGIGPFYEFNILEIQKKYEDESFHYENGFGMELMANYAFSPSEKWKILFGTTAFIPVSNSAGTWMSFDVGFDYKLSEKEVTIK
jgi:hypothetical protein